MDEWPSEGPRLQIEDFKLQIADCKLQTANCKLQIASFRSQSTICNSQSAIFNLQLGSPTSGTSLCLSRLSARGHFVGEGDERSRKSRPEASYSSVPVRTTSTSDQEGETSTRWPRLTSPFSRVANRRTDGARQGFVFPTA